MFQVLLRGVVERRIFTYKNFANTNSGTSAELGWRKGRDFLVYRTYLVKKKIR
jgi:hypothetical protein